jgi:hypothetical protein
VPTVRLAIRMISRSSGDEFPSPVMLEGLMMVQCSMDSTFSDSNKIQLLIILVWLLFTYSQITDQRRNYVYRCVSVCDLPVLSSIQAQPPSKEIGLSSINYQRSLAF